MTTHKPTGISVTCDVARSQHTNRQQAFEKLCAILALRPQQFGLTGCNCRWDGDTQVQWCELHLAHKEAIHEWAERAKEAEKQLAQPAEGGKAPVWNSIQIASWIGSQLMHEPSMFERAAVCKFVRSLGRHPTLLKHSPAEGGEVPVRWELCKHCGHDVKEPCHHNQNPNAARNCHWNQERTRVLGTGMVDNRPDTTPQPASQEQPIKDHQIAQIVNQLRDIAIEFGGTQQLRERIAVVIVPMLKAQQPATGEPVAWLDEMLADTREVFDANGSETPQAVRDVIEYVASWVTVYREKNHPAPSVPDDVVRVPLQVLKDASAALGNFVSDHGWGDTDMQAMDNLDAYIARHDAKAQKGQP